MRLGGRRRPRESGEQKREHRVTIWLNDAELERLERYTAATGASPARVFMTALSERDESFERISFARHVSADLVITNRQLAGACNNLNQIAHGVNIDGNVDHLMLAAALADINAAVKQVRAVLDEAYGCTERS